MSVCRCESACAGNVDAPFSIATGKLVRSIGVRPWWQLCSDQALALDVAQVSESKYERWMRHLCRGARRIARALRLQYSVQRALELLPIAGSNDSLVLTSLNRAAREPCQPPLHSRWSRRFGDHSATA